MNPKKAKRHRRRSRLRKKEKTHSQIINRIIWCRENLIEVSGSKTSTKKIIQAMEKWNSQHSKNQNVGQIKSGEEVFQILQTFFPKLKWELAPHRRKTFYF